MSNEVEPDNLNQNNNHEEKHPLQDLDISNMILIKHPNNEVALGKMQF
jgi:hypothetical protein